MHEYRSNLQDENCLKSLQEGIDLKSFEITDQCGNECNLVCVYWPFDYLEVIFVVMFPD